jgi:hypothetical protein
MPPKGGVKPPIAPGVVRSVLQKRIDGVEIRKALGPNATSKQLQDYISRSVATEISRISAAEKLADALNKPGSVAIHVSCSWG